MKLLINSSHRLRNHLGNQFDLPLCKMSKFIMDKIIDLDSKELLNPNTKIQYNICRKCIEHQLKHL